MNLWLIILIGWIALSAVLLVFFKGCSTETFDENERPVKKP